MSGNKKKYIILICVAMLSLSACTIGTSSLFIHPTEQGYSYEVTYDCLGGHINQMKTRTVYYTEDSLLYEPSGTAGMLVAPKNGEKTIIGWYTHYTATETANGIVYYFEEEDRWDFSSDRVSVETTPDETLFLYARWADNPNINFVDAESPEGGNLLKWVITLGSVLSRPTSAEPVKNGHTLIDYYKDPECTIRYEFGQVIGEDDILINDLGNAYINIYCKFIEGEYIRIKTVAQLKAIEAEPDEHYILANDLDMSGEVFTPITSFSGVLNGNGYNVCNLTLNVRNKVSGVAALKAEESSYGLFAKLDGAEIVDLTMKDTKIVIDKSSNVNICAGVLAGRTTKSNITDCIFDGITFETEGNFSIDITISPTVAGDSTTKLNNCVVNNYDEPEVVTKGTLTKLSGF